jgi:hypothetical protein
MAIAVRIIQWVLGLAGLSALVLGLTMWIFHIDLVNIHMLLGFTVALLLLILSIMMLFVREVRVLGIVGIIYAPILPLFGLTQMGLLVGDLHWLIQIAHLLVGLGALSLMGIMSRRYLDLRSPTLETTPHRDVVTSPEK